MGWRGFLLASVGLIALYTVVQPGAANRVGGLADFAGQAAHRFLDPSSPAIGAPHYSQ